jgi:hypothetical protein
VQRGQARLRDSQTGDRSEKTMPGVGTPGICSLSIFAASRDQPISSGSNRFAAIAGRTGFAPRIFAGGKQIRTAGPSRERGGLSRETENCRRGLAPEPAGSVYPDKASGPPRERRSLGHHFLDVFVRHT